MEIKLKIGADLKSIRTTDDDPFCRVFGKGSGNQCSSEARERTAELVCRWNSNPALIAALERILSINGSTGGDKSLVAEYRHIAAEALRIAQSA